MSIERRYALLKHTHTAEEIEGGAGLADGDYGDITVSGSGTAMTIDDDVVSNAKLADMNEGTIKGRAEGAGTGNPADLTMDELRAMLHLGSGAEVRGASFAGFNSALRVPVGKVNITIKEDCTISKCVVLTQGGPGSCVIDIQREDFADFPPDSSDSIVGATPPTITADVKYEDEALTDWFTTLSAGDTLQFELLSTSNFTAIFVFLVLQPVGSQATDGYTDDRVREILAEEFANPEDFLPISIPAVPDTIPMRDEDAYLYAATPPDGDSSTKVATTEFVEDFVVPDSSVGASGYSVNPDGSIDQWGYDIRTGSSPQAVAFPISFPNGVSGIFLTERVASGGSLGQSSVVSGSPTTSGFNLAHADNAAGTYWFAKGY